jgi:hypothetical protein
MFKTFAEPTFEQATHVKSINLLNQDPLLLKTTFSFADYHSDT